MPAHWCSRGCPLLRCFMFADRARVRLALNDSEGGLQGCNRRRLWGCGRPCVRRVRPWLFAAGEDRRECHAPSQHCGERGEDYRANEPCDSWSANRLRLRGRAPPQRRDSVRARRPFACATSGGPRELGGELGASRHRWLDRRRMDHLGHLGSALRRQLVEVGGRLRVSRCCARAVRVAGAASLQVLEVGIGGRSAVVGRFGGWSLGGGTRLPREKVPTSSCSANIVLASRLRSASLGSPFRRMRTTLVSGWSRPSIVPLQADVYARIAL